MDKVVKALTNLQPDANWSITGEDITTEEEFNNIEWVVGTEPDGRSIMSEVNPYPELTWSTFSAEKNRLQTEYDAQEYARKRKTEYPSIQDLVVALYDTDDKAAIDSKRAEIKLKYPKPVA